MELLHDLHFLRSAFSIYVLSDDGWSWALAWAQLGVDFICCVPFNGLALDQLKCLQNHSALGKLIHLVAPSVPLPVPPSRSTTRREGGPLSRTLVCGHFGAEPAEGEEDWTMLDLLRQTAGDGGRDPSCVALVSIAPNRRHLQARVRDALGPAMKWREIRHRNLGGLSSARLLVGWGGASSTCSLVEPGQRRAPTRPLDRFLERAVILAEWRKVDSRRSVGVTRNRGFGTDCWRPAAANAKPYPWPWREAPLWVEAPSVFAFAQGVSIERRLTLKERCQIVDLRADWGKELLEPVWAWNEGASVPLRMLVEFVMAARGWLNQAAEGLTEPGASTALQKRSLQAAEENRSQSAPDEIDWGRVRAPWLGDASDKDSAGTTAWEKRVYFGWTWEAGDSEEEDVMVATKNDDAGVNLALWAVGGDEGPLAPRTSPRNPEELDAAAVGALPAKGSLRLVTEARRQLRLHARPGGHRRLRHKVCERNMVGLG